MTFPRIASKDNQTLKLTKLVASESRRAPQDLVLAEGIRVLEEVETAGCEIDSVVVSEDFGASDRERNLLERWEARKLRIYSVAEKLFKSVSTVLSPQGAIALVRLPEISLDKIKTEDNPLILCACGIQDPGNLGALLRTAAAVNCSFVCTTSGTVSARNPKTIRSSAGAFFRMPVAEHIAIGLLLQYCRARGIMLFRTDVRDGASYALADMKAPSAILLGNEGAGLNEKELAGLPAIHIPISDKVESLNVATAGAIILFEARRQRTLL